MTTSLEDLTTALPTLYALDSSGRIKVWSVSICIHLDQSATYTVIHGLLDGKKQRSPRKITSGKNIGKANETSPYAQALSEAQSKWKKQIDKGYVEDVNNIPVCTEVEYFLPMLAQKYTERSKHMKYPAYVQPKFDGYRALSRRIGKQVVLWSRTGKPFFTLDIIVSELESIISSNECLDGEVYRHDWRSPSNEPDFQRVSSAIKKRKADTDLLEYHVYDRPIPEKPEASFYERFYKPAFIDGTLVGSDHVKIVPTALVASEEEMMLLFNQWVSEDLPYEGAIVRNASGVYGFDTRSNDLLKVKDFQEEEYEIIGAKEGTGKDEGTAIFLCKMKDGTEFDSRPVGSYEQRAEYLTNISKYIGRYLRVRFNGLSNLGVPRFNRGVGIREEWDM